METPQPPPLTPIHLVFVPSLGIGHLASTLQFAKLLASHDHRIIVTVLRISISSDDTRSSSGFETQSHPRVHLQDITVDSSLLPANQSTESPILQLRATIEASKPFVREAVANLCNSTSTRLAGFVVDMFCVDLIDVANDLGIPTYLFFTCGAAALDVFFQYQSLYDKIGDEASSFTDLHVPTFKTPVPTRLLPNHLIKGGIVTEKFTSLMRRFRETKGILINSVEELESHAFHSLSGRADIPAIYPAGPIINLEQTSGSQRDDLVLEWLHAQPPSSVIFLCFGSMGRFQEEQVREIAVALERCGYRFLWTLRRPAPKPMVVNSDDDFFNVEEILPEGFLERTKGIGKIVGWAPQVKVLAHPAVGGFVSHCGWNSTLEAIWWGVPMATWPLYAEQRINALQLVEELGLATAIRLDSGTGRGGEGPELVPAEDIEKGVCEMMEGGESGKERMRKLEEAKGQSRGALEDGGSSYKALQTFVCSLW